MSSRVNDAPRASNRVIFYEDQQYTETRTTSRRPARYRDDAVRDDEGPRGRTRDDDRYADDSRYADDRGDSRRYEDEAPRSSRSRRSEDDAPRRRDDEDAPRRSTRSRSRDDDSYVRFDPDRPVRVKIEKDPEKKENGFTSTARTGAVWASRILGIGGFALACLGGVLAIGGTHIIPGIGSPPNIGPGVLLLGVGGAAYLGGGILEKTLSKDKKE